MEEQLISIETDKLAREKGIILEQCRCGGFPDCVCEYMKNINKRPTQSLMQKWLREKYDTHFVPHAFTNPLTNSTFYEYDLESDLVKECDKNNQPFESYEETLEDYLQEALKLI